MYCANCGNNLPDDAKFCDACGAPAVTAENAEGNVEESPSTTAPESGTALPKGSKVTENIVLGTDGKYHWYYEFKLMKNPTILKVLWKIFFWIFVGMWVFLSLVNALDGHFNKKDFLDFSKIFLLLLIGVEALVAVSYFIYAAINRFKYCVLFEMDEDGVKHIQMPGQFKKSQAMSFITMMMGVASGRPGVTGTGILAASRSSMVSSWSAVRSVEIIRKHNVIKVNERMGKNQVYAEDADFQFVEEFIRKHVSKKCSIK